MVIAVQWTVRHEAWGWFQHMHIDTPFITLQGIQRKRKNRALKCKVRVKEVAYYSHLSLGKWLPPSVLPQSSSATAMGAEASTQHPNVPDLPPTHVNKTEKLLSRRTKCGGRIMGDLLYRNKWPAGKERNVHGKWDPDEWEMNPDSHPKSYCHTVWVNSCYNS